MVARAITNHNMYFLLMVIKIIDGNGNLTYPCIFARCWTYCGLHWQVDEIINISCPLRGRYQQAPPGLKRCLKLSMTDGSQRVFGMEYRPIHALEVCAPSGLKVSFSVATLFLFILNLGYIDLLHFRKQF